SWALSVHAFSHSRRARRPLVDSHVLAVFEIARTDDALTLGLLGAGGGLCAECPDQRSDRTDLSYCRNRSLSSLDRKSEAPVQAAPSARSTTRFPQYPPWRF